MRDEATTPRSMAMRAVPGGSRVRRALRGSFVDMAGNRESSLSHAGVVRVMTARWTCARSEPCRPKFRPNLGHLKRRNETYPRTLNEKQAKVGQSSAPHSVEWAKSGHLWPKAVATW